MAIQGVSSVVLVSPAIPAQELNVIESALRASGAGVAGARHVVKITSKASPDSPIARRRGQAQIENRVIAFHPITCEGQKQAMINAGLPEVVADDNAKALTLFADGDADYVTDDVPALLGRPAAASSSSSPTLPQLSHDCQPGARAISA